MYRYVHADCKNADELKDLVKREGAVYDSEGCLLYQYDGDTLYCYSKGGTKFPGHGSIYAEAHRRIEYSLEARDKLIEKRELFLKFKDDLENIYLSVQSEQLKPLARQIASYENAIGDINKQLTNS